MGLIISLENSKLGRIPNISLPPIASCPGKSEACAKLCYAYKGRSRMAADKQWLDNFNQLKERVADLLKVSNFLRRQKKKKPFRIHAGGDFYNVPYTKMWINLVNSHADVIFYSYTRSWRIPRILPHLVELGHLPNVKLWWSCDVETGEPPPGFKRAYMMLNDNDQPAYPVDLIFRVERESVMKQLPNTKVPVCPVENGTQQGKKLTCLKCGICFR